MKLKGLLRFITSVSVIIAIVGIIMIVFGYDRPANAEGVGPRGGHWHITSGGNKSYYQTKTDRWGQKEINATGKLGWFLAVIFILTALGCGHWANTIIPNSKAISQKKEIVKTYETSIHTKEQKSFMDKHEIEFDKNTTEK